MTGEAVSSFSEWAKRAAAGRTDTDTEDETEEHPAADGLLDLAALRSGPLPPRTWLEQGIFELGAVNKLTAASGVGKSILLAHMAVNWSLGRSALDVDNGSPRLLEQPLSVLYVDGELGPRWWHTKLEKLKAPTELPNLHVVTLADNAPVWSALSEWEGATAFLAWVDRLEDDLDGVDVIVLDTLSAFVGGEENDNDTWLAFDRLVTLPLKRAGFTVLYADHSGHSSERARGGSAKRAKLDIEWFLDAPDENRPNDLVLSNDHRRGKMRDGFDGHPQVVHLSRVDDPLGHVRTGAIDRPGSDQSAVDRAALVQVFNDADDGLTRTEACTSANGARKRLETEFDAMVSTGRLISEKVTTTNARGEKRTRTQFQLNPTGSGKMRLPMPKSTEHSRSEQEVSK